MISSISVSLVFGLVVALTLFWFYKATRTKTYLWISLTIVIIQSTIALSGFYQNSLVLPPRIMLFGALPSLLLIFFVMFSAAGKKWMDQLSLRSLTNFHVIRVPVEIVLSLLYYQGLVSVYMTFEGTNFDILSGLSAPLVAYWFFTKKSLATRALLLWNITCLLLLLNVVITAIFALPTPFQLLAFDQPNIAILYFPFILLPTVVVPTVLLAHVIAIRQLLKPKRLAAGQG